MVGGRAGPYSLGSQGKDQESQGNQSITWAHMQGGDGPVPGSWGVSGLIRHSEQQEEPHPERPQYNPRIPLPECSPLGQKTPHESTGA